MYTPTEKDLESEFFYKEIKSQYQYNHVLGNCKLHLGPLSRIVRDRPYQFDLGVFGDRNAWNNNRERHAKDLIWAIDIQLRQLYQWRVKAIGSEPIDIECLLKYDKNLIPAQWRDLLAKRWIVYRWLHSKRK